MPNAQRVDDRLLRRTPIRPLVLLAIDDDDVRARLAYELNASGFNVTLTTPTAARPSIIVATLSVENRGGGFPAGTRAGDPRFRGVPVIAIAADASHATRDLARRQGCVAVCVTTCSGATLAAGMRAVLDRGR
jgi:DNA-binding response OmpR family regulator